MNLRRDNLTIRNATIADSEQLCLWWNDGKIMAHAGYPNGLGLTSDEIAIDLASDSDETMRRHMIESDGRPIGEMNYRRLHTHGSDKEIVIFLAARISDCKSRSSM